MNNAGVIASNVSCGFVILDEVILFNAKDWNDYNKDFKVAIVMFESGSNQLTLRFSDDSKRALAIENDKDALRALKFLADNKDIECLVLVDDYNGNTMGYHFFLNTRDLEATAKNM